MDNQKYMIIINSTLSLKEIEESHRDFFDTMVKIVVDIEKEFVALNAEMHADLEELLLENGSEQKNLWGANIYFSKPDEIEFTSLINIRPAQSNKSMEVLDPEIRKKMAHIVQKRITR